MNEEVLKAGKKLKELRGDKSLRDVEKDTGISWSQLSKYERGVSEPGFSALAALVKYYNVSLDWLLGFTEDPRPIVIERDLSEASKAEILNFVEYIKNKEEK